MPELLKLISISGFCSVLSITGCSSTLHTNEDKVEPNAELVQRLDETFEQYQMRLYDERFKKAFQRTQNAIEKYGYKSIEYKLAADDELRASLARLENTKKVLNKLDMDIQITEQKHVQELERKKQLNATTYKELDQLKEKKNVLEIELDLIRDELNILKQVVNLENEMASISAMGNERIFSSNATTTQKLQANEKYSKQRAERKSQYEEAYDNYRLKLNEFIEKSEEMKNILDKISTLMLKVNLIEQER